MGIYNTIFIKRPILSLLISLSIFSILVGLLSTIDYSQNNNSNLIHYSHSTQDCNLRIDVASIIISSVYEINDDNNGNSIGDGDGNVDAGETIELRLELENNGDTTATDVFGNLTSTNPYVSIGSHNQSYSQIAVGATALSISYYLIEFNSKLNASDEIDFSLQITALEGSWSDSFTLTIIDVPELVFYGHVVSYEYDGDLNANDNEIIDPGEIVYFDLFVENQGGSTLYGADGYLETTDPYITLIDDSGVFGTIDSDGGYEEGHFAMDVQGDCPEGHIISFTLSLEDKYSNFWNVSFELVVSGTPEYFLEDITFYEYFGDEDNIVDAGETWTAEITIRNIGTAIGPGVYVSMDSSDSNIEFYYEFETRGESFGDLKAGFSNSKDVYDWRFTISDRVVISQTLNLIVVVEDENGLLVNLNTSLQIIGVANYNLTEFAVVEYCYYDDDICNGLVDAGDTLIANITIENIGEAIGNDIEIFLYSSERRIDFYYGNGTSYDFDTLEIGEVYSAYGYYEWEFTISEWVKAGLEIDFTIVIRDASQRNWTFTTSIIVETGPNTFYHTTLGKIAIFGGSAVFIAICIVPNIYKRRKSGATIIGDFKKRQEKKKKERTKVRKQKQKQKEAKRQQEERERIASINENEKRMLEKFESILEMSDRVSLQQVAKSLAISEAQLFEMLIHWQDRLPFKIDGEMIEVEDADDFSQSIREQIAETVKYYSCYNCGFPIERSTEVCPDCKNSIDKCDLCKLPISFGESIGKCPLCETTGHLIHLQEWVKTQGKCPVCLQKISVDDIIQYEQEKSKKNK